MVVLELIEVLSIASCSCASCVGVSPIVQQTTPKFICSKTKFVDV